MRAHLFEFFRPTEEEFDVLWRDATVIPDANVLLTLLRYNSKTSNEVLNLFDSIKQKMWLPHQFGLEFLKNSNQVSISMEKPYTRLDALYADLRNNIIQEIDNIKSEYRYHPSLDFDQHKIEVEDTFVKIKHNLNKIKEKHPPSNASQNIIDAVAGLFEGRIGDSYASVLFEGHCAEAKRRFEAGVPPGYADKKKDDGGFGDFIAWMQMIDYAKENKKDVIFITEDGKDDWWFRVSGKTIGPRPELRREFYEKTSCRFYMYSLPLWLELIRKKKGNIISSDAVAEAKAQQDREADFVYVNNARRRNLIIQAVELRQSKANIEEKMKLINDKYIGLVNDLENDKYNNIYRGAENDQEMAKMARWVERRKSAIRDEMINLRRQLHTLNRDWEAIAAELENSDYKEVLDASLPIAKM